VLEDPASLLAAGLELAKVIASKSPIAVQGSKINLIYSRDHSVQDGLAFMVR
jgi:delta(3,5)-delta(2,4)-dienoyl-CoA isomerase